MGDVATKVRRWLARINYMSRDGPDLSAGAKVMSQHMSKPREGVVRVLKRWVRHLKKYPVMAALVPRGVTEDECDLVAWTDSDWAGDVSARRSTSGGLITHRAPKYSPNVALSSAEAELNATVKGLSELIGLNNLISETIHVKPTMTLCTDASSCKRMILRHGTGKVEHLSVKQLWSQEVVRFHDIQVRKVTRASDPADMLTHSVGFAIAEQQLARFNASRGKLKTDFFVSETTACFSRTEVQVSWMHHSSERTT